jgi:hypothetical protein
MGSSSARTSRQGAQVQHVDHQVEVLGVRRLCGLCCLRRQASSGLATIPLMWAKRVHGVGSTRHGKDYKMHQPWQHRGGGDSATGTVMVCSTPKQAGVHNGVGLHKCPPVRCKLAQRASALCPREGALIVTQAWKTACQTESAP